MSRAEPSISFDEALERLRDGYSDSYDGWLTGMNDVLDVARELDLDDMGFVGKPRTQHAIWRYQHHDAETVRSQISTTIEKHSLGITTDEAVEKLRLVAEEL